MVQAIHKRLCTIGTKHNRWIEKIQKFDFEVRYCKSEELAMSDALSRLHESNRKESKKGKIEENKKGKVRAQQQGKWNNHVVVKKMKKHAKHSIEGIMEVVNLWRYRDH